MSGLPPISWNLLIDRENIGSGDMLVQQENLIRQIKALGEETSEAIYGRSERFQPVAQGGTSAGAATSYDVQVGHYVRVGRLCWFTMNLQWDDANHTGTGALQITGLPVPAYDVADAKQLVTVYNAQSTSEFVGVGFIEPGDSTISVIKSAGTTVQIDGADYELQITGQYRIL